METKANTWGMINKLSTIHLTTMAMTIAVRFVLGLIPGFKFGNVVEFGVGFIGSALSGALLGPFYATITAIVYDILDFFLSNSGYMFFPGFTLSAALGGLFYGIGLWRKDKNFKNIFLTVLAITIIINIILNTLWIKMMYGGAWVALIQPRLIKNLISLPLNTVVLYYIFNIPQIKQFIQRRQF